MTGAVWLTRSRFTVLYKEFFGLPPNEELVKMRLELGERLLKETELSVKEIAGKCGYGSVEYFIRLFKKHHGVPPGKFRG